jgi:N-acetylglucosaminyldiphosphoundecaprenol N-acetyl-beta-D-mannosaminyltransferase
MNEFIPQSSNETATARRLVLGLPFTAVSAPAALERCLEIVNRREPRHVITANTDFLAKAEADPDVRRLMFEADEVFCDGMPLVWASRLFERPGRGLPARVTGSDLVPRLLDRLAAAGKSVFFLGSDEATLKRLTQKLSQELPALKIAGAVAPPMGPIDSWDNESLVETIRSARPDVLMVAVGFPKQDQWIQRFGSLIGVPLMIGVGASLDFIAGKQTRAPRWMQVSGLEWIWRLGTDPKRLARRYLDDAAVFARVIGRQLRATLRNHLPVWGARPADGAMGRRADRTGTSTLDR